MRLKFRLTVAAGSGSTARAGNKGAGVGQNKGGYLAEETEACWVIEGGEGGRFPAQHSVLSAGDKAIVV